MRPPKLIQVFFNDTATTEIYTPLIQKAYRVARLKVSRSPATAAVSAGKSPPLSGSSDTSNTVSFHGPEAEVKAFVERQLADASLEMGPEALEQCTELLVTGFSGNADMVEQVLDPAMARGQKLPCRLRVRLTPGDGREFLPTSFPPQRLA